MSAVTRSVRILPSAIVAVVAVAGLYGCSNSTARSANSSVSPSGPVGSPSTPLVGLAGPQPTVCQPILSASDLSGVAAEADSVVEGTSPGKTSVLLDSDASQFDVTKVLKTVPGVDPSGAIEIIFGPPNTGDYLPAGKYLLFLQYNTIAKVYTIPSSSLGNAVADREFLLNGDTATQQRCASGPPDTSPANAVASADAAVSASGIHVPELEGFATQLSLAQAPGVAPSSASQAPVATSQTATASP